MFRYLSTSSVGKIISNNTKLTLVIVQRSIINILKG